ncbi:MAG: cupin domain-containing protein [Acidobacteriota bacterium]
MSDSGSPRLETWGEDDGPLTEKRVMGFLEREGYEVAIYAYREGTEFAEHAHAQDKCDAVLEGFFRIRVGGEVFDMKPGDRLYIPDGTRHTAEVSGRRTVVCLDATRW